tara:strand:- start:1320 stop:2339 length:1020 start_codon:yes stop_codon:yes gene_type:complete
MAAENSYAGLLAGTLGGVGAGIMGAGIASGLGAYKPLPALDLTDQTELRGATTSRPEISNLLRKAFAQSKERESLLGYLVDEMAGGVVSAGTAQQVARAAQKDASVGRAYLSARLDEGSHKTTMTRAKDAFVNDLIKKSVEGAAVFGADLLATSSPDGGDPVESSVKSGLREQLSPGDITAPSSMPNLRLQEAARKQGQESVFGPVDLALDPGAAVLGMQPELGSVQAFDPNAPFGAVDPSVTGKYVSASPLVPSMMIPENQMTRDESKLQDATEGAMPVTRVRAAPSSESIEFQGALGQEGEVGKGKPKAKMPDSLKELDKLDPETREMLVRLLGGQI